MKSYKDLMEVLDYQVVIKRKNLKFISRKYNDKFKDSSNQNIIAETLSAVEDEIVAYFKKIETRTKKFLSDKRLLNHKDFNLIEEIYKKLKDNPLGYLNLYIAGTTESRNRIYQAFFKKELKKNKILQKSKIKIVQKGEDLKLIGEYIS